MPKNIVLFSDGTGQVGGDGEDTNVYKLFTSIENRTNQQIAFYDRGLGTGFRKKITGKLFGMGIGKNILDCYQFIFENFQSKDKIYLFGFSRGAATVRSLSGFIETFGILPKSRPELIGDAWKIYKIRDKDKRISKAGEFTKRHHTMWTKIEFLGVWDTVAALGVPFVPVDAVVNRIPFLRHKFHDFGLSPGVVNAYQALSIDEERKPFLPILWNESVQSEQQMEQVWFAGVHTDVGGGYEETGLSDIALNWLLEKATDNKLRIYKKDIAKFKGNADGRVHDSREGWKKILYCKQIRSWPEFDENGVRREKPSIHPSVFERTLNKKNVKGTKYDPWIFHWPN